MLYRPLISAYVCIFTQIWNDHSVHPDFNYVINHLVDLQKPEPITEF